MSSEIAFDGDVELVSDSAFRTYFEIISISGHYLLDGVVPMRLVRKLCNSPNIKAALTELSFGEQPYLTVTEDTVTVRNYGKWQETSDQVKRRREVDAERQRKHRTPDVTPNGTEHGCHGVTDTVTNGVTDTVSHGPTSVQSTEYREESKSTEEEKDSPRGADAPLETAQTIVAFAADFCREHGYDLVADVKGHLAREIGKQFKEGRDPVLIRDGVAELMELNKSPQQLSWVMGDIQRRRNGGRTGTDRRVQVGAANGRSENGEW